MRVGLDIDNVITAFDDKILEEFYIEDKKKRNSGIVNPDGEWIKHRFDWSKEEIENFFNNNMERIAHELEPIKDAKYYMDKLLGDGHELYLISHRAYPHYTKPFETTIDWLSKNKINYTKLVLSKSTNKSVECIENNIDVMFDDVKSNCKKMIEAGIDCYLMETKYNIVNKEGLKSVSNWRNLYSTICNLAAKKLDKIPVILDTDTNNEADDQFALAYLLNSKDRINIEAVTIVPYSHQNDISIEEGINKSYEVAKEVFKLCNEISDNIIFKGSTNYISSGYEDTNDAVNKIIEVSNRNDLTYVIAIGALTNIALAVKKYPEIINKVKVIWLGGNSLLSSDNREYNFKQDIEANRIVFYSGVDLIVIPCKNVASNLVTTIYELEHHFDISKGLGKFLYDRFYSDGKHGITPRRVIWDISAVAYTINPYWFEKEKIRCPLITDELKYIKSDYSHNITFITNLDVNSIYEDMFKKIGDR